MPARTHRISAPRLRIDFRVSRKLARVETPRLHRQGKPPDAPAASSRLKSRAAVRQVTSVGKYWRRSFAFGSAPWWLHAIAVAQKPTTVIAIGLVAVCAVIAKTINVVYVHRAKIIAAKSSRDVAKLQVQSEAEIAKLRAAVHSLLLLSGNEAMVRAEVFNPDLPEGRRLSDDHIIKAISSDETKEGGGGQPGSGPTAVILPMDQGDGAA